MLLKLFLLFIVVPLMELAILLQLAEVTGWQFTLLLVIATGAAGSLLARSQGWKAYRRIHQALAAGSMPAEPMLDAVMIFVAGALLLTPGILTDLFGFSLLLPWSRGIYRKRLAAWFKSRFHAVPMNPGSWQRQSTPPDVIDSYVVDRPSEAEAGEAKPND